MDQLLALPVKGEAFLLRRGCHSVLVDSGWNGRSLAAAIKSCAPDLREIDVAVCTHADGDHARGFKDFLAHWRVTGPGEREVPGKIGQFWLPGSWADVLPELMRDPRAFGNGLITALDELTSEQPNLAEHEGDAEDLAEELDALVRIEREAVADREFPYEDLGRETEFEFDPFFDDAEIDLGATEPLDEPAWFDEMRRRVDEIVITRPIAIKAFQSCRRRIRYRRTRGKIGAALSQFWLGLIDSAFSIRAIAEIAIERRIRVRWFDFDEFARTRRASGGVRGFLVPLNAVEQAPVPRTGLSYLARLSPINEACLAFFAPPTVTRLGVVFCGDSPLGNGLQYSDSFLAGLPRPRLPVIATAPHHGSESNQIAYRHLSSWATVCVWLRTGGSKKQPGPTFKALRFPTRICSHCPQSGLKLQKAGVIGTCRWPCFGPLWIMGHYCACT